VRHLDLPDAGCELRSLEQFFLDDVDRDGRRELVVDAISASEEIEGHRRGESVEVHEVRQLWVLELGGQQAAPREQLHLLVTKHLDVREQRMFWVDLNRDERPDLVQLADCEANELELDDDPGLCDDRVMARTWHLYHRELDRWIDDEAPATAAAAAPPTPATTPAAPAAAAPPPPAAPAPAPATAPTAPTAPTAGGAR
jgi:pyruvate/2-oxoglutarate dehydrogenase complex dihydrolipoamide acyltransferase (E2) component